MNLCSVSWEVIHMTSRAIRGLVPNLSGDNLCISSSHLLPFSILPPPWETTHQKRGHLSVWSWTRSQRTVHIYTFVCMPVFFLFFSLQMYVVSTPQRQKGDEEQLSHRLSLRSHLSEMDLTLEDGRGPVVHALALDGSKALLLCSESQQRSGWTHQVYCKADRCGTLGTLWFCPLVFNRHRSL